MKYEVRIEKAALKQLSKLEKEIRERIRLKIRTLADDLRPHGYKKLVDEGGTCRVKVGDYRILYDIFDRVLIVSVISIAKRERTDLLNIIGRWINAQRLREESCQIIDFTDFIS